MISSSWIPVVVKSLFSACVGQFVVAGWQDRFSDRASSQPGNPWVHGTSTSCCRCCTCSCPW